MLSKSNQFLCKRIFTIFSSTIVLIAMLGTLSSPSLGLADAGTDPVIRLSSDDAPSCAGDNGSSCIEVSFKADMSQTASYVFDCDSKGTYVDLPLLKALALFLGIDIPPYIPIPPTPVPACSLFALGSTFRITDTTPNTGEGIILEKTYPGRSEGQLALAAGHTYKLSFMAHGRDFRDALEDKQWGSFDSFAEVTYQELDPNDDICENAIPFDLPYSGNLEFGSDHDWQQIKSPIKGTMVLTLDVPDDKDYQLEVWSDDCQAIWVPSPNGTGVDEKLVMPVEPVNYRVHVYGKTPGDFGSWYSVSALWDLDDNQWENAESFTPPFHGNLEYSGDEDWQTIYIPAGGTFLTLNVPDDKNYDLELWRDDTKVQLSASHNDTGIDERILVADPGSYRIHIYGIDPAIDFNDPYIVSFSTHFVDTGDVEGLISAINAANDEITHPGLDTIILSGGAYFLTAPNPLGGPDGPTGLPSISSEIVIEGNGAVIDRPALTPEVFRIVHVAPGGDLLLSNVTITGGFTGNWGTEPPLEEFAPGGGIYNAGKLTLDYSAVIDNGHEGERQKIIEGSGFATQGQSGNGAGIYNLGELMVFGSEIAFNKAGYSFGGRGGGIYNDGGNVSINTSLIWYNFAPEGGGIENHQGGSIKIANTALVGNHSRFFGGAIFNDGDAILTNSTVSGNNDAIANGGQMAIINTTITNNTQYREAGGIVTGIYDEAILTMVNTIVSDNNANNGHNCAGEITSLGYNIDSDGTCGLTGSGDQVGIDPMLGPLQDNGGDTLTHALLRGSPAINAAKASACPEKDQRGVPRPQGRKCDIGAFEYYLPVTIDIKPNDPNNRIACLNPDFLIRVAVFSTPEFDALAINHRSVRFEGASEYQLNAAGRPVRREVDVNGDGRMDLLFIFRLGDTTLTCDSQIAYLTGLMNDQSPVRGWEAIQMK